MRGSSVFLYKKRIVKERLFRWEGKKLYMHGGLIHLFFLLK
jgi:hypothetical protein